MICHNLGHSIEGPKSRGFSYIEIWFVGMQIPIIFGIMEYAMLLTMKRYLPIKSIEIIHVQPNGNLNQDKNQMDLDDFSKKIDKWTLIG